MKLEICVLNSFIRIARSDAENTCVILLHEIKNTFRQSRELSDEGITPSLPAPPQHPVPSAGIDPGRTERRGHHPLSQSGPAERTAAGAEASPEISEIDRRLGELHEFLRRAKGGGLGDGGITVPVVSSRRGDASLENGNS